ncbi:MAG TPA: hypothetical protein VM367_00420 [Pseudonocardia sp.]|nr:hypothetical protein [Pseudonocardia sp.]
MAEPTQEDLDDVRRQQQRAPQAGGRSHRGPEVDAGGDDSGPQVPVPPYEDRTRGGEQTDERVAKAFDASNAAPPGPGGVESETEREGVPPTDTTGRTPLGVGTTRGGRGEDTAGGGGTEGHKGPSGRPYGQADSEGTGIDRREPDPDAPDG